MSRIFLALLFTLPAVAQHPVDPLATSSAANPLTQPNVPAGALELYNLEFRFAADVAKGGGTAFASWFADDAVTLNNGKPAVLGRTAITAATHWNPKPTNLPGLLKERRWVHPATQASPGVTISVSRTTKTTRR